MELTLYAQGSDLAPPKPDIQEGFDYAVNFATNILTNPAVIGTILKAQPIIVLGTHYSQPIMAAFVLAGLLSFLINPHLILSSSSTLFHIILPLFYLSFTSFSHFTSFSQFTSLSTHLYLILNSLSPHFTSLSSHFHLSLTSF